MESSELFYELKNMSKYNLFGADVILVRTLQDNTVEKEFMPAALAVWLLSNEYYNGSKYISAKIIWNEVNSRDWDMSA